MKFKIKYMALNHHCSGNWFFHMPIIRDEQNSIRYKKINKNLNFE